MEHSKQNNHVRFQRRRQLAAVALVCASIVVSALPAGASPPSPSIAAKQSEAARVLEQVNQLDSEVNRAAEQFDAANLHLAQTTKALRVNTQLLRFARANLKRSRSRKEARLVALYTSGESDSTVEFVLGATSLDEAIARLDAQQRIADQDARIAREVASFDTEVRTRQAKLSVDRRSAASLVAERAAQRRTIESQLRERERLLSSVRSEVERLQVEERARQAVVIRRARARLAAEARRAASARAAEQVPAKPAAALPTPPVLTPPVVTPPVSTPPASTPEPVATAPPPASAAPTAPATLTANSAPAVAPPSARYGGVVDIAMRYLGVPYVWGGATPKGFDCSGFTMYIYAQIGVSLPHYTGDQWRMGTAVPRDQLQPGDLLFFDGLGHEGMYIGGNQFIHAPHTGDVVKISPITGWYASTYMGARRL